jgi:hypothetical protein
LCNESETSKPSNLKDDAIKIEEECKRLTKGTKSGKK